MIIDKQQDGNYKITDGKDVLSNLLPLSVFDYVKTFLRMERVDVTDTKNIKDADLSVEPIWHEGKRVDAERRIK